MGATFRRWAGQEFRAQVATDASSFILRCRNKKLPIRWQKCVEKGGNYVEKWEYFYFVELCFNKKLKAEVSLYLIHPRILLWNKGSVHSVGNLKKVYTMMHSQKNIKLHWKMFWMKNVGCNYIHIYIYIYFNITYQLFDFWENWQSYTTTVRITLNLTQKPLL